MNSKKQNPSEDVAVLRRDKNIFKRNEREGKLTEQHEKPFDLENLQKDKSRENYLKCFCSKTNKSH